MFKLALISCLVACAFALPQWTPAQQQALIIQEATVNNLRERALPVQAVTNAAHEAAIQKILALQGRTAADSPLHQGELDRVRQSEAKLIALRDQQLAQQIANQQAGYY